MYTTHASHHSSSRTAQSGLHTLGRPLAVAQSCPRQQIDRTSAWMLSNGSCALNANVADIDSWLTLDPASLPGAAHELSFTATPESGGGSSGFKLLPLNRVVDQVYTAHFNISVGAFQVREGDLPELPGAAWKAR
jgi:hypothetical protein